MKNQVNAIEVGNWVSFFYIGTQETIVGQNQFQVSEISPCGRIATIGQNLKCRCDQLRVVPAPIDFTPFEDAKTIECDMNAIVNELGFLATI